MSENIADIAARVVAPNRAQWMQKPHSEWDNDDLLACARWWAQELGLCSWEIKAYFEPRFQTEGTARITYNGRTEQAKLRLCPWPERDLDDSVENDAEADVVHELLHARFWAIQQPDTSVDADSQMFELALDRTARALVRQRRRGQ